MRIYICTEKGVFIRKILCYATMSFIHLQHYIFKGLPEAIVSGGGGNGGIRQGDAKNVYSVRIR